MVTRSSLLLMLAIAPGAFGLLVSPTVSAFAQTAPAPQAPPAAEEPPEEDVPETQKTKEYAFNPIQAEKEVKVGAYYFKRGSFKAALGRYQEALRWDPNNAEATLRLGDTHEKLGNLKDAREAWGRFLKLSPDAKDAEGVRKKLAARS